MRWALAPLRWRGEDRPAQPLRLFRWRLSHPRVFHDEAPAGPPHGYLQSEHVQGSLPLFEATHPITSDQLLSTGLEEIEQLGYSAVRLLGFVHASLPLTGIPPSDRPWMGWAKYGGRRVGGVEALPACPGGRIDLPAAEALVPTLPIEVVGWAMLGSEAVFLGSEVTVDGRTVGLARLGLQRLDLAERCACDGAPIAGWSFELRAEDLGNPQGRFTVGATAHGVLGSRVELARLRSRSQRAPGNEVSDLIAPATEPDRFRAHGVPDGEGLRILAVAHSLSLGGAQLYLAELLERLVSSGASVTVVAPTDGPLRQRLALSGITVHLSPAPQPWTSGPFDSRVAELSAWAAPQRFDLVVVNTLTVFHGVEVAKPPRLAEHLRDPREPRSRPRTGCAIWLPTTPGSGPGCSGRSRPRRRSCSRPRRRGACSSITPTPIA